MSYRGVLTLSLLLLSCLVVAAKDKKKATQPRDVLQAHTAWVIIDPHAGMDLTDPNANRIAREDVETLWPGGEGSRRLPTRRKPTSSSLSARATANWSSQRSATEPVHI